MVRKFALLCMLTAYGCSKDHNGPAPGSVILISPEENTLCTNGMLQTDSTTSLIFTWENSLNTSSYELHYKNLISRDSTSMPVKTNQAVAILQRGQPYSWYVISKSSQTPVTTKSVIWKFYIAGPGAVTYAPYPAELTAPVFGAKVAAGNVDLTWTGSDIDNDITGYDVYFGTTLNPPLLQSNIGNMYLNGLAITANTTYYWKIVTHDSKGNTSLSDLFQFSVQ